MDGRPKVDQYTINYMINEWNAKLLKPQRLVGIGLAEEEKRCLGAWQLFDWVLRLAAFEDISELGDHVIEPEKFRAFLNSCSSPVIRCHAGSKLSPVSRSSLSLRLLQAGRGGKDKI